MANSTSTTYRLKRKILTFTNKISYRLPKPDLKFISDMVYGIPTQLHETVQKTNTVKWHSKHLSTGTPATSAASYLFLCFVTSK